MKNIFLFIILCVSAHVFGQKHDYNWALGDPGPHVDDHVGFFFSFSTNPVSFPIAPRNLILTPVSSTMSDEEGNIQFYSNGCVVFNWLDSLMENGDNINPGSIHDNYCGASYPTNQNLLSIPVPNKIDQYYLFHSAINDDYFNGFVYLRKHYFSMIDMTKNGGLGQVTQKNQLMLTDTMAPAIAATKHSNGIDWWIHYWRYFGDQAVFFLAKEDTIEGPFYQFLNLNFDSQTLGAGMSLFTPDGTKYIYYDTKNDINIYEFDRTLGTLTDYVHITVPDSSTSGFLYGGAAVSPNNRFLYISNSWDVYQFDLWEDDIESSKVHLAHYDLVADPFPTSFYAMQLGPDCRIYMSTPSDTRYLHVIHNPDEKGLDCNFETRGIKLPSGHNFTIPFFPNYRLGQTYSYPCDSTLELPITSITEPKPPNTYGDEVTVFPNPTNDAFTIRRKNGIHEKGEIQIFDIHGRFIYSEVLPMGMTELTINSENWPSGIYIGVVNCSDGPFKAFRITKQE